MTDEQLRMVAEQLANRPEFAGTTAMVRGCGEIAFEAYLCGLAAGYKLAVEDSRKALSRGAQK